MAIAQEKYIDGTKQQENYPFHIQVKSELLPSGTAPRAYSFEHDDACDCVSDSYSTLVLDQMNARPYRLSRPNLEPTATAVECIDFLRCYQGRASLNENLEVSLTR